MANLEMWWRSWRCGGEVEDVVAKLEKWWLR